MIDKLKTSTREKIRRIDINLNPYNPKTHTEEVIKKQAKNIKKVGYLGGIVWNRISHNLIDGHRRIFALDLIHKYDGTPETDYEIEVDVVEFDDKTEKEQMTYMAIGNTKADLMMIATYSKELDLAGIGVSEADIREINLYIDAEKDVDIPSFDTLLTPPITSESTAPINNLSTSMGMGVGMGTPNEKSYEERKAIVQNGKLMQQQQMLDASQSKRAYITLSFLDYDTKAEFMQYMGYDPTETMVAGEEFLEKLQER